MPAMQVATARRKVVVPREEWIGAIEEGGECNAIREVQAIEERRGKAAFP